jgi:hypothetical protein
MLGLQPDDDVLPDVQIIDAAQARRDAQRRRIEDERIARERVAQEVRERLEAERVAREIAAANNAGDVDVIPGSLMTEEQFQEFCRQRGMLVDLRGKINHGEIGRGISNSEVWETRDGKRYKVKKSQSDNKSRNESLMHAIWLAMGVQATEGGLGEFVNGAGVTRVVLADRFQDGILPRDAFWPNAFSDANFRNPAYQQAIADLHEGLLLDVLQGQWDLSLNGNSGNAFLVVKDGVIRGVRCDGGTGGPYGAGNDRSNGHFDAPPIEFMERIFGRGFLNNGRIAGSSQEGNWNRGLTLDALKAIARRTILPLTDQRIDALVDNAELRVKLQQRRLKILEAFGIDPNEQPPVGTAARVPQAIPGVRVPTLQDDGYEYGPVLPNGKKTVKLRGTVRADGIFVPENYANLPIEVRNGIESGELLPENLPFMSEAVPSNGLPLDANGMPEGNLPVFVGSDGIRRISPFGAVSLFIRKRDRNGNYVYIGVRPPWMLNAENFSMRKSVLCTSVKSV